MIIEPFSLSVEASIFRRGVGHQISDKRGCRPPTTIGVRKLRVIAPSSTQSKRVTHGQNYNSQDRASRAASPRYTSGFKLVTCFSESYTTKQKGTSFPSTLCTYNAYDKRPSKQVSSFNSEKRIETQITSLISSLLAILARPSSNIVHLLIMPPVPNYTSLTSTNANVGNYACSGNMTVMKPSQRR